MKIQYEHRCLSCGEELSVLSVFKDMPGSAQDLPSGEELKDDKGLDLILCKCKACSLIQLDTEPVPYYKDVIRSGGISTTMQRLRSEEYERLLLALDENGFKKAKILEAGCGRGEFLKMWEGISGDYTVFGIENNPSLCEEARRNGLIVYNFFAEDGNTIPASPYDAFVQFNFLEHQPHPRDMLKTIRKNLKPGGLGLLTVPSFEYIMEYGGYYELLRDHIAYYTCSSLRKLVEECGFSVLSERIVLEDTIEILLKNTGELVSGEKKIADGMLPDNMPPDNILTDKRVPEEHINDKDLDVSLISENYERLSKEIEALTERYRSSGKTLAVWGASHQGLTICSSTCLKDELRYIIDSSPFKQGKYAPASHIKIVPPEYFFNEPVSVILIAAPEYTDEIAGIIRKRYGSDLELKCLRFGRIESL